ncbi:hypothetical protein N7451_012034 [Penicillium sp. IBT 35674x]|nr:hypothetical protein N7451_012034 [Penicillium sp. IBT 35674x]
MASPSDTIVIADEEDEPGSSRPQRAPRRDYSYRDFEADMTPPRKRRRTKKEPSALVPVPHKTYPSHFELIMDQDDAFGGLRKAIDHDIQLLQDSNQMLRDQLRLESECHQRRKRSFSSTRKGVCFTARSATCSQIAG